MLRSKKPNSRGAMLRHASLHHLVDGPRSMKAFLKGTLNCSGTIANKLRRRAELVNHHSTAGDLLLAGRIGVEQVDLLAKAHAHRIAGDRFAEFAPQLLDHAEHLEHDDFATVIDHFINMADPDGSFDAQRFQETERAASVTETNGAIEVHASGGSPLAAAEMVAVFDHAVQNEFLKDCATRRSVYGDQAYDHPLPRTVQQRKFDALHTIFIDSVAAPADGKRPEPLVNVVIDHVTAGHVLHDHNLVDSPDILGVGDDAFEAGERDLLDRHCSINATPVHPDAALRAMIHGRVRRAVIDADRVTINLGRTQRLFTRHSRHAAQLLVATCTRRGCDTPAAFCDTDHRVEWTNNAGPTNQHNAMVMCGTDDRWKHNNNIRTRRATNGRIYLIRPDDTTIKPIGQTEPDWAEPHPTEPHPTETPPTATNSPPTVKTPSYPRCAPSPPSRAVRPLARFV